jgi:polyhydroxyalkanoate synthesis regulator phasin
MKRFWKVAGIATLVAILGVVAIGTVVFAQEDGEGFPFDFGAKFREAIASALGIDVETYDAAVETARDQVVEEAVAEGWLTEDQAQRMQERMDQGFGEPGMGKGFMGPRGGFMGRDGDSIIGLIAEELDLSMQDLFAELQDGKTLGELAAEKGVDVEAVTAKYLAQLEENLKQAVEDGKITQNQADLMLKQAEERVPDLLNNTWEGRFPGGHPGGRRPGGTWGFPGQSDA